MKSIGNVYSGSSGKMATTDLKMSLRRGDSPLEGVSAELLSAVYYWSPVCQMYLTATLSAQFCR